MFINPFVVCAVDDSVRFSDANIDHITLCHHAIQVDRFAVIVLVALVNQVEKVRVGS